MKRSDNGRFIVWNDGKDPYNYLDLLYNWQVLDKMFGNAGPGGAGFTGGGTGSGGVNAGRRQDITGIPAPWLGDGDSSRIYFKESDIDNPDPLKAARAPSRNLYRIIYALTANQGPLGEIKMWYRHSDSIDPPAGFAICDGRTLPESEHSYGTGTYTVPDLRNKFILGADAGKSKTTAANAADNLNYADGNSIGGLETNAPGIGYDSIRNTTPATRKAKNSTRNLSHTHAPGSFTAAAHVHDMVHVHVGGAHSHMLQEHTHSINHVHVVPDHVHTVQANTGDASGNVWTDVRGNPQGAASPPNWQASGRSHYHYISTPTSSVASGAIGYTSSFGAGYFPKGFPHPMFTSIQIDHTNNTQNQVQSGAGVWPQGPYTYNDGQVWTGPAIYANLGGFGNPNPTGPRNGTGSTSAPVTGTSDQAGWLYSTEVTSNQIDTRNAYVGLLYIQKVKKYFGIIDGDRALFDSE